MSPVLTNISIHFAQRNNLASNLDKAICRRSFGMKDHGNQIIQQGVKAKLEYYHPLEVSIVLLLN